MWGALLPPDMAVHFFQSFTQNGGFQSHGCTAKWLLCIREHPIKMNYLGVPPFIETPKWGATASRSTVQVYVPRWWSIGGDVPSLICCGSPSN